MSYLSIDPGRDSGFAVFADSEHMVACGLGPPWDRPSGWLIRHVVIEKPVIYRANKMKGDPNDIVTLAIMVGEYKRWALDSLGCVAELIKPHEWKGTTPKEIENHRTMAALSLEERAIVKKAAYTVPVGKHHNILDAIGLGRACFRLRLWR